MKPSKWLLAAMRALAASMTGCTASARVFVAGKKDFGLTPAGFQRCLQLSGGGPFRSTLAWRRRSSCVILLFTKYSVKYFLCFCETLCPTIYET